LPVYSPGWAEDACYMAEKMICRGIGWSPDFDSEADVILKPDVKSFDTPIFLAINIR
jgi:hypothetical protein